jgi:AraC family transcriptional activator of pyochelin receptor
LCDYQLIMKIKINIMKKNVAGNAYQSFDIEEGQKGMRNMHIQAEFSEFTEYNQVITDQLEWARSEEIDGMERLHDLPPHYGEGYHRHVAVREGLRLDYSNMYLHQTFSMETKMKYPHLELAFNIESGANWTVNGGQQEFCSQTGSAQLIYMNDLTCHAQMPKHERISHLELSFDYRLWSQLLEAMNACPEQSFARLETTITPGMTHIIEQVISNPYRGTIKKLFIEGKAMELLALFLQEAELEKEQRISLKADDVKSIHEAKNILLKTLDHPPSLIHLARKVGINDYKLKIGFKEVFGTTVFGFVRQQRLEKAKLLLERERVSVSEAALLVGYSNFSHFASLFRKTYGVNPSLYGKRLEKP